MAQTVGTVLSKVMKIYTGGTPTAITCQNDLTLSVTTETFETTCKDTSASWADSSPGTISWTVTGSANFAFDATNGYSQLLASQIAGSTVAVVVQNANAGDKKYSGNTIVTSLELDASGINTAATYTFTLTGKGALAETTIP